MLQQEKKRQIALQILKANFINTFLEVVSNNKRRFSKQQQNKPSPNNIKGKVIDETKNSFILETPSGEKQVLKQNNFFILTFPDKKKYKIDGNLLIGNVWDRLKK